MLRILTRTALLEVRSLIGPPCHHGTRQLISKRGIRGVMKTFRTPLPRFKNNLKDLPPLTGLLTQSDASCALLQDAIELRREKLGVYKQYLPNGSNTNLIEALFHPDNEVGRLLEIIGENLETMSSFYLGISFEVIDDAIRANLCDPLTIAVSPEFRQLCTKTLYKIRHFEADEILKLLRCLSTIRMPENTLLVQAAFQMARHLINDFDVDELDCLSDSLSSFKAIEEADKSLLVALKKAIPLAQKALIESNQYSSLDEPTTIKFPDRTSNKESHDKIK